MTHITPVNFVNTRFSGSSISKPSGDVDAWLKNEIAQILRECRQEPATNPSSKKNSQPKKIVGNETLANLMVDVVPHRNRRQESAITGEFADAWVSNLDGSIATFSQGIKKTIEALQSTQPEVAQRLQQLSNFVLHHFWPAGDINKIAFTQRVEDEFKSIVKMGNDESTDDAKQAGLQPGPNRTRNGVWRALFDLIAEHAEPAFQQALKQNNH